MWMGSVKSYIVLSSDGHNMLTLGRVSSLSGCSFFGGALHSLCKMDEENELMALRRKKLDMLRAKDLEPFGSGFEVNGSIGEVREQFKEGEAVRAAGRITAHRDMGKSHFLDLRDATGRIQIYIHAKEVGPELMDLFHLLDIGDLIGVEGTYFLTKSGEPTLKVRTFQLLAKALRPLPEKWHGLQDIEARYRQRYLDLLTNDHSRAVFQKRIAIVRETRRFLEERGFLEVETPILQTIAGGAAAEPFNTHHKALGLDLYLRIAPELYLKRLLVGGFNKVFEISRNFRNEGISRKHNPEFTMLEVYWAYADFEKMANLVEELICYLAEKICGSLTIEHRDADGEIVRTINLKRPWRRARYHDVVRDVAGKDWFELSSEQRRDRAIERIQIGNPAATGRFRGDSACVRETGRGKNDRSAVCDALPERTGAAGKTKRSRQLAGRCF